MKQNKRNKSEMLIFKDIFNDTYFNLTLFIEKILNVKYFSCIDADDINNGNFI